VAGTAAGGEQKGRRVVSGTGGIGCKSEGVVGDGGGGKKTAEE
jgi:hypothetical protein